MSPNLRITVYYPAIFAQPPAAMAFVMLSQNPTSVHCKKCIGQNDGTHQVLTMSSQIYICRSSRRERRVMPAICLTKMEFVKFLLTRCGKIVTIKAPQLDLTAKTVKL